MRLQQLFETRTVQGVEPKDFLQYLRSPEQIKEALREHYPNSVQFSSIVNLFAEHNMAPADNVLLKVSPQSLIPFREYTRDSMDERGWTGKMTGEEFEALKADIKENGIKEPGWFYMERNRSDWSVKAYLGEGNHRLRIALDIGLKSFPIKFRVHK